MNWRRRLNRLGLILIAAGLLICFGTWQWFRENPFELNPAQDGFERVELTLGGMDTPELLIIERNSAVRLALSEDDRFHIICHETEHDKLVLTEGSDGSLTLSRVDEREWYERISFFSTAAECTMIVAVPQGYAGSVILQTSNGGILAEETCAAGTLSLKTSNGSVVVRNQALDRLNVETSNAAVSLEQISCKGDIRAVTSNGRVIAQDLAGEEELSIKTSNANIALERVQAADFFVSTSNGSITGSIIGSEQDYAVSAKTSNGNLRVPEGRDGAPGELRVTTSNGNIELEFVD